MTYNCLKLSIVSHSTDYSEAKLLVSYKSVATHELPKLQDPRVHFDTTRTRVLSTRVLCKTEPDIYMELCY